MESHRDPARHHGRLSPKGSSSSDVFQRPPEAQARRGKRSATATDDAGIERYLGSGRIRYIGPAYAKRLVKTFGEAVFDVIEGEPGRLREVEGIGPVRAARIAAGWAE